jgi:hypothetical protein
MSVTIQKSTSGAIFYIQNPGESESTPYTVNDFDMIPTGDGISLSLVRKFRRTVVNDQINTSDIILKQPYTNVINGDTGIAFASYGAYRTYIETNFFRKAGGGSGGSSTWGSITGTLSSQTDLQTALDGKLSLSGGSLIGSVTSTQTPTGLTEITRLGDLELIDTVLTGCVTTASGTTATTTAGTWRISNLVYSKGTSTSTTIPAQDATLSRYVVIYGTTSNTILGVNGTLSTDPVQPDIPANTVLIDVILITATTVSVVSGGGRRGSGTVTQVIGINTNGFNWSIANSTTVPAITLRLQDATASQSGQLNSTDWNTFNNKTTLPSQTGNSGKLLSTNGSTPSWATVSNGLTPTSTTLKLGGVLTAPTTIDLSSTFHFLFSFTNGDISVNGLTIGRGGSRVAGNTALGSNALAANTGGGNNAAVGSGALQVNTNGAQNTAVGNSTLQSNIGGGGNVALGYQALNLNDSTGNNTAIGTGALSQNPSGSGNTAIGTGAGTLSTGSNNIYIGTSAGSISGTGDNKLYIDITNTSTPLIGGDFVARTLAFNGTGTITDPNSVGLLYAADYSANYTDRSLIDRGFANANYIPLTFSSTLDANILGQGLNFVLDSGTDHLRLSMGDSSLSIFGYDVTGANCSLVNAPTSFAVNASDSGSLSQAGINVQSSGDTVYSQIRFQDLGSGFQKTLFFGSNGGVGIILEDSIDNIGLVGDSDYSTNTISNNNAYTQVSATKKLINKGPQQLSTTDRLALTPTEGDQVYDLTLHKLYVYDGTTWQGAW